MAISSFLQLAAALFPDSISTQVAIQEIAIPDSSVCGLCGGQGLSRYCHLGCLSAAFQNVVKCSYSLHIINVSLKEISTQNSLPVFQKYQALYFWEVAVAG